MLDINKLIGFVMYTQKPPLLESIKTSISLITPTLDPDDAAIVQDTYVQGSGLITAAIKNYNQCIDYNSFIKTTKSLIKFIGEADLNNSKIIFVISDLFNDDMVYSLNKLTSINKRYDYPSNLHFMKIGESDGNNDISVFKNVNLAIDEIKTILELNNVI